MTIFLVTAALFLTMIIALNLYAENCDLKNDAIILEENRDNLLEICLKTVKAVYVDKRTGEIVVSEDLEYIGEL